MTAAIPEIEEKLIQACETAKSAGEQLDFMFFGNGRYVIGAMLGFTRSQWDSVGYGFLGSSPNRPGDMSDEYALGARLRARFGGQG